MKFFKKHSTQNRFYNCKLGWVKRLPNPNEVVIVTRNSENIHPSFWKVEWFKNEVKAKEYLKDYKEEEVYVYMCPDCTSEDIGESSDLLNECKKCGCTWC